MKHYIKELLGVTLFIIIPVVLVIAITKFPSPYLDMGPADGPPHNYWVPPYDDTIELKPEDSLDLDTNIVHWEVWNDTLYIYTKEDSIRDEIKRIRYIQSLDKECLDLTGTTQGEYTYEEQLNIEPDYIYYDTPQTYKNK